MKSICTLILVLMADAAYGQSNLPACQGSLVSSWSNCSGSETLNGNKYVGEFKVGKYNGQGTAIGSNGDNYVGEFKDGLIHGQGTVTTSNGNKYVGWFKQNKMHGQGTLTGPKDVKYVGEFKEGSMHGRGTLTSENGYKYVGEFKNGLMHGQGTATGSNGDKYVGEFQDNNYNGRGIKYSSGGSIEESGIYKDGDLVTSQYIDPNSFTRIQPNKSTAEVSNSERLRIADEIRRLDTDSESLSFSSLYIFMDTIYGAVVSRYKLKVAGVEMPQIFGYKYVQLSLPPGQYLIESERDGVGGTTLNLEVGRGEKHYIYINPVGFPRPKPTLVKVDEKRGLEGIGKSSKLTISEKSLALLAEKGINIDFSAIHEAKVNLPSTNTNNLNKDDKTSFKRERQQTADERQSLEDDKRQREQAKARKRINLQVNHTQPSADGDLTINVETNTDTASLKINGEEQGGRANGLYAVKRVARAGQETRFEIYAKDVYGNTDIKTITVSRTVVESKVTYQQLNPDRIKRQPERDAVAVIIGISNYKSLPKAEFAKDDAQVFYDYAIRALGVKPGNIKLLMDEQADAEEIYTAFKTWLPARVKSTTDVYVFYSGHGLPTQDGSGLYWLPQRANRDLISKTGILLSEVNSDIQASKPKSVTIFMDACYSGQARGGETLVASARPIALKSQPTTFPSNFTVISASQADQISSSSPDLQHGIFSYYLMRGMEGEADLNSDGKITLDETQQYLSENVGRHARTMNRQQEPQVIGDGSRILVSR